MNTRNLISLAAALAIAAAPAFAQNPTRRNQSNTLKTVMQAKLEYSKTILEGLALEDFAKIRKNSQQLGLLSLESSWEIIQTEEYVKQSREFRRTADLIHQAASEENLERAALGYVALTVRCIECHSYLRKQHPELRATEKDPSSAAQAKPQVPEK